MKKKVLVIHSELNKAFRQLHHLQEKGHEVITAPTTAAVEAYYKEDIYDHLNYFDIIILDPFMPLGIFSGENDDEANTGYFLYERFLRDLKSTKIVIWTWRMSDYSDKPWKDKVIIRQKDHHDHYSLLHIVEEFTGLLQCIGKTRLVLSGFFYLN